MADEDLRNLERESHRDPEAFTRWILAKVRAGLLPQENVELAAGLGSSEALQLVGTGWNNIWKCLDTMPTPPGRTKHAKLAIAMCYRIQTAPALSVASEFLELMSKVVAQLELYLEHPLERKKMRPLFMELDVECQNALNRTNTPREGFLVNMLRCAVAAQIEKWGNTMPRELVSVTYPSWFTSPHIQAYGKHRLPSHLMVSAYEYFCRYFTPARVYPAPQDAFLQAGRPQQPQPLTRAEMETVEQGLRDALIRILLGINSQEGSGKQRYRRNSETPYSPERDDYQCHPGEVFQEKIQKKLFVAIASSLLATLSDDKKRLILARPFKRTFTPIDTPLWQVPEKWGISIEIFNELFSRHSIEIKKQSPKQREREHKLMAAVRDIISGVPPTQVVEKHNIDIKTLKHYFRSTDQMDIYQQAKRKGIRRKPGSSGTYKGDEYWNSVLQDIRDGIHYEDVAKKWELDTPAKRTRLFFHLRKAGLLEAVKLRDGSQGRSKLTPADWNSILNKIVEGHTVTDAIQGFDITRTAVNSFLKRYDSSPDQLRQQGIPEELKKLLETAISISSPKTS